MTGLAVMSLSDLGQRRADAKTRSMSVRKARSTAPSRYMMVGTGEGMNPNSKGTHTADHATSTRMHLRAHHRSGFSTCVVLHCTALYCTVW